MNEQAQIVNAQQTPDEGFAEFTANGYSPMLGNKTTDLVLGYDDEMEPQQAAVKVLSFLYPENSFEVLSAQWVGVDVGDWEERVLHVLARETMDGSTVTALALPI